MGDEKEQEPKPTAIVTDFSGMVRAIAEEMGEQVRFVVTLDPNSPTIAFTIPDCGSEELGYKVRHVGSVATVVIDQVFKWTSTDNYDVAEGEDHDPSIA